MKNKVLIVGIDSTIGRGLKKSLDEDGMPVSGTTRRSDSLSETTFFFDLANPKFDLPFDKFTHAVICASWTNMAKCEEDPGECHRLNVENTIQLIERLLANKVFVTFLSSTTVFDGQKSFYTPNDATAPVNNYGRSKADVESFLMKHSAGRAAVLRLTKLITNEASFLKNWINAASEGREILAFQDRLLSPVSLDSVVNALKRLIQSKAPGIFHIGGDKELSYYDFAKEYFSNQNAVLKLIKPSLDPLVKDRKIAHHSLATHLPS